MGFFNFCKYYSFKLFQLPWKVYKAVWRKIKKRKQKILFEGKAYVDVIKKCQSEGIKANANESYEGKFCKKWIEI